MAIHMSLANHLLVAMPKQNDVIFSRSVIYICDYHELGTVGLMINKPTEYPVKLIFEHLGLESSSESISCQPLMFGGPIQPERGFVIHRPVGRWNSSLLLNDDVTITTSNDIINDIVLGKGPKDSLVTLGYAGWESNKLEQEIINDLWLVCPFKAELLYDVPFNERWKEAALTIGVRMEQLIPGGGHA